MATRTCTSCHKNLPKSEFSKNQLAKKGASKCKGCVAGDGNGSNDQAEAKSDDPSAVKGEKIVSVKTVGVAVDEAKNSADEASAAE